MIAGTAYAKVNLGLRVGALREDGFHELTGIFQSINIADRLSLAEADADVISSTEGRPVADGADNLAFRAAVAVRAAAGQSRPLAMTLDKAIPAVAGLGGGSADAACGLGLAGRYFGVSPDVLTELAPQLGSDVPFCLVGGTARVSGRGDRVETIDTLAGFTLAIVVPPVEVPTPAAFRLWDELGGPEGLRMAQAALPPVMRSEGDLINDLYPAAAAIAPEIDDWRADLEASWGRPVMLSGSGPALFGFFLDTDEATCAVAAIPRGARFAESCDPVPVGWQFTDESLR